ISTTPPPASITPLLPYTTLFRSMPNLWPKISDIAVPTCIIVGSFDEKFIKIGYHMCDLIPETSLYEVSGSGHTVHVEEMTEFDKRVLGFIFKEEQND